PEVVRISAASTVDEVLARPRRGVERITQHSRLAWSVLRWRQGADGFPASVDRRLLGRRGTEDLGQLLYARRDRIAAHGAVARTTDPERLPVHRDGEDGFPVGSTIVVAEQRWRLGERRANVGVVDRGTDRLRVDSGILTTCGELVGADAFVRRRRGPGELATSLDAPRCGARARSVEFCPLDRRAHAARVALRRRAIAQAPALESHARWREARVRTPIGVKRERLMAVSPRSAALPRTEMRKSYRVLHASARGHGSTNTKSVAPAARSAGARSNDTGWMQPASQGLAASSWQSRKVSGDVGVYASTNSG